MYIDAIPSTASERFLKGIRCLENEIRFDEQKLRKEDKEIKAKLRKAISRKVSKDAIDITLSSQARYLAIRLKLKYRLSDIAPIYVLKKVDSPLVDQFITAAGESAFWDDAQDHLFDDAHLLWFSKEVGLGENPHFLEAVDNLVKNQSIEGYIQSNDLNHSGPLRALVATRPESQVLSNATNYWLRYWKDISNDAGTLAVGVLALTDLDSEKYSSAIREELDYLKRFQNDDGSWGLTFSEPYSRDGRIDHTSYALWAISAVDGIQDPSMQKGLDWLGRRQQENGSWENNSRDTALALIALLAAGEGPKVPLQLVDYRLMKFKQTLKAQRPLFIHTSPIYRNTLHVREIQSKISDMLNKAQREIRIASPFIDVFYEEIINRKQENPNLVVRIITRPKQEADGLRQKIAKNVIDLLDIATKGNVVQSTLVHSRMVIIDDDEVLISSADLTRDQLFDEFNAGIWTSDKETVRKATDFFENLFRLEKEKK